MVLVAILHIQKIVDGHEALIVFVHIHLLGLHRLLYRSAWCHLDLMALLLLWLNDRAVIISSPVLPPVNALDELPRLQQMLVVVHCMA